LTVQTALKTEKGLNCSGIHEKNNCSATSCESIAITRNILTYKHEERNRECEPSPYSIFSNVAKAISGMPHEA
jgi:hypothetical protein